MPEKSLDEPALQILLEVGNYDALEELLQVVNCTDIQVRTRDISKAGIYKEMTVSFDFDVLTTKQREALTLALKEEYYDRPRETDLAHLAEQLGVSKSAVSQRLRNAEITLIKHAFQQCE